MNLNDRMIFAGSVVKLSMLVIMTIATFLVLLSAPVLMVAQIWL